MIIIGKFKVLYCIYRLDLVLIYGYQIIRVGLFSFGVLISFFFYGYVFIFVIFQD